MPAAYPRCEWNPSLWVSPLNPACDSNEAPSRLSTLLKMLGLSTSLQNGNCKKLLPRPLSGTPASRSLNARNALHPKRSTPNVVEIFWVDLDAPPHQSGHPLIHNVPCHGVIRTLRTLLYTHESLAWRNPQLTLLPRQECC